MTESNPPQPPTEKLSALHWSSAKGWSSTEIDWPSDENDGDRCLRLIGFDLQFQIGTQALVVKIYHKGPWPLGQYMLDVWDRDSGGPFIVVDHFGDVMELLSKWAPSIQAAALSSLIAGDGDVHSGADWSELSTIKYIATAVAAGVSEMPEMRRELDKRRRAERERWLARQRMKDRSVDHD